MSTDADLVAAARDGDSSAFGKLAERYRDAAFGIAYSRLGDFEAARDAAQDALITAYRDLPTLADPSKFAGWLRRIAVTSAVNVVRRRKTTASLDKPGATEPSDRASDPERLAKTEEVREALAALPESDRLALVLHYINGYSHAEIGAMLDASVPAVKSRIHRAKGRLRKEMCEVVEQTLKESVLEQLHLPPLRFRADYGRFDPAYREFLEIEITEVYGSSALPRVGDNYLIGGRYTLMQHTPIKKIDELDPWLVERYDEQVAPQVVTVFAAAANSTSTGTQAFLTPGSGEFATNLFVKEVVDPRRPLLILMIDNDTNAIDIHLEA